MLNGMARFHLLLATLAAALLAPTGSAAPSSSSTPSYWLLHDYVPETFFNNFTFFNGPADPTHGTVNYLSSHKEAVNKRLIGTGTADDGTTTVKIAVDAKTKLQGNAGRNSIRITSKNKYNKGLFVFDVVHMPPSVCGLWPALWLLGEPEAEWPKNGEVDIIEGVNQQSGNLMTLHTKSDCKIGNSVSSTSTDPDVITYTGKRTTVNCNAYSGNGCQIAAPKGSSSTSDSAEQAAGSSYSSGATYGSPLNAQGGAIVAVEWTDSGFKIWSWPRSSAPSSVKSTTASNPSDVTPSNDFGTPVAHFGGQGCAWNDNFKDLAFVINTDFCGDWAGNVDWNGGSCTKKTGYKTCSNYVRDHPEAFTQAYWEFGPVRYFAPSTSWGYSGSSFAGGSASDGALEGSNGGFEYGDNSQLAGDAPNTTAPSDDTYNALSSDTQNSTTPILDSVPTTLLSVARLASTPA
ncbi:mixed-linked glucanase precursor [Phyllosticta paracitricarpa]|uniref:Mixed-linked glucanase n=2 Tax=Phyllosticta TaxID=121621 RepID=A0ABR1MZ44_9PEZI